MINLGWKIFFKVYRTLLQTFMLMLNSVFTPVNGKRARNGKCKIWSGVQVDLLCIKMGREIAITPLTYPSLDSYSDVSLLLGLITL